jgi:Holliday junction resolvase-like predicted endonuclease
MEQDQIKSNNKIIGQYGEDIAARFLEKRGFQVLDRNYLKKWGEIDIVARKTNKIHFIEVKSVSYETKDLLDSIVSRGTWKPEDNVHPYKVRKLNRAIESWLHEKHCELDWQIDVIAVKMVVREKYASVKYLPNIIFD